MLCVFFWTFISAYTVIRIAYINTYTYIYSEIINALELLKVFLKFGVNDLIFHPGIFQESPEFLQSI